MTTDAMPSNAMAKSFRYIALLLFISLTACETRFVPAYTAASDADEPSKRISSCGYVVGFRDGSVAITQAAYGILEKAANEARARKTKTIAVYSSYSGTEGETFQDKRARAIADDLERLGFSAGEVSVGHVYDRGPSRPTGFVNVCDLIDEKRSQTTPPREPEQRISYRIGAAELSIPIRFLSPYIWRDTPLEPRSTLELSLYFGWPGLQDRLSDVMQRCTLTGINSCEDRVIATIVPSSRRQPDYTPRQLPRKTELVPILGQAYGGSWFVYRNWPQRDQGLLQTTDDDGTPFIVSCRSFEWHEPTQSGWEPTLAGVKVLVHAPGSYCEMRFALTPTLDARVIFGAKNLASWPIIRTDLRNLLRQWQG